MSSRQPMCSKLEIKSDKFEGAYNRTSRPAICHHPGGAGVDEGTGVDEGDFFYTGFLFYTDTLFCRDAVIEEASGRSRRQKTKEYRRSLFYTGLFYTGHRCRRSRAAGSGRAR